MKPLIFFLSFFSPPEFVPVSPLAFSPVALVNDLFIFLSLPRTHLLRPILFFFFRKSSNAQEYRIPPYCLFLNVFISVADMNLNSLSRIVAYSLTQDLYQTLISYLTVFTAVIYLAIYGDAVKFSQILYDILSRPPGHRSGKSSFRYITTIASSPLLSVQPWPVCLYWIYHFYFFPHVRGRTRRGVA